jgi:hypothetical protein
MKQPAWSECYNHGHRPPPPTTPTRKALKGLDYAHTAIGTISIYIHMHAMYT